MLGPQPFAIAALLAGPIPAGSFIVSDDLDEVRGKLEHTVFHAHLSQLFSVAASRGFEPARGWARVREEIDRCYAVWAREPDCDPRRASELAADHDALTAKVLRLPERDEIDSPVEEQLIVELYSK